jgi:transcriptional regulator with XRE-family HTH domain
MAVRKLRLQAGLSQADLASRCELDPSWIGRIETGQANPTWGNVRRIAAGLGVPLEEVAELAESLENEDTSP